MVKISASLLSARDNLEKTIEEINNLDIDYIHLDIMDGKFVPNTSFTHEEIKTIVSSINKPLDVHLMVKDPAKYIEDYALLNTTNLIFHYEAVKDIESMISLVKEYGLKVGIAINPETSEEVLFPYLKDIDVALVMSVVPGKSGQSFIENTLSKIKNLKEEIIRQGVKTIISVDGGINDETGLLCKEAGADMLVSASYIHKDIVNNIKVLKDL